MTSAAQSQSDLCHYWLPMLTDLGPSWLTLRCIAGGKEPAEIIGLGYQWHWVNLFYLLCKDVLTLVQQPWDYLFVCWNIELAMGQSADRWHWQTTDREAALHILPHLFCMFAHAHCHTPHSSKVVGARLKRRRAIMQIMIQACRLVY